MLGCVVRRFSSSPGVSVTSAGRWRPAPWRSRRPRYPGGKPASFRCYATGRRVSGGDASGDRGGRVRRTGGPGTTGSGDGGIRVQPAGLETGVRVQRVLIRGSGSGDGGSGPGTVRVCRSLPQLCHRRSVESFANRSERRVFAPPSASSTPGDGGAPTATPAGGYAEEQHGGC